MMTLMQIAQGSIFREIRRHSDREATIRTLSSLIILGPYFG